MTRGSAGSSSSSSSSSGYMHKSCDVVVDEDVRYGVGGVAFEPGEGAGRHRALLLDVYRPAGAATGLRPALIMAFGGAFSRGSRRDDAVLEDGHRNTPVAEYCREFARRGYVCFSIDYRLMQERPDPGVTPTLPPGVALNLDRVNHVRGLLGLPPCTSQMLVDEIEAVTDDVVNAVSFVRSRWQAYGIDPDRIAVGGFSAGAIGALNAALAERAPVAAVVALSGRITQATAEACIRGAKGEPAVLMFLGENDLPAMLANLDGPTGHMRRMGLPHRVVRIAGGTHFYPRDARVEESDGSYTDVEGVMARFLHEHLDLAGLSG